MQNGPSWSRAANRTTSGRRGQQDAGQDSQQDSQFPSPMLPRGGQVTGTATVPTSWTGHIRLGLGDSTLCVKAHLGDQGGCCHWSTGGFTEYDLHWLGSWRQRRRWEGRTLSLLAPHHQGGPGFHSKCCGPCTRLRPAAGCVGGGKCLDAAVHLRLTWQGLWQCGCMGIYPEFYSIGSPKRHPNEGQGLQSAAG